jgi:hypothetical protein
MADGVAEGSQGEVRALLSVEGLRFIENGEPSVGSGQGDSCRSVR